MAKLPKLPKIPNLSTQQYAMFGAVGVALCFAFGLYAFRGVIWIPDTEPVPQVPAEDLVPEWRHPLTGAPAEAEVANPAVFGVMIENSLEAWPLSGLEDAFLVIEAPVESGIPRFVAFYGEDQEVSQIGPVRSARPYYLDWAQEFRALYAHSGGSNEALELIQSGGIFDLNEFYNGQNFWRSSSRFAPHNLYTSSRLLLTALERRRDAETAPELDYDAWLFKQDEPVESEEEIGDLTVEFSSPAYNAGWRYEPETNSYLRLQAGLPFTMMDGDTISANNVAVVVTEIQVIDDVGRRKIETLGEGEALVLQDGEFILATWKKPSADDRLRFFHEDGEEIQWNAGKTWIEVIQSKENVIVTGEPDLF